MNDLMKSVLELFGMDETNSTVKQMPDGSVIVTMKSNSSNKPDTDKSLAGIKKLAHAVFGNDFDIDSAQLTANHDEENSAVKAAQEQTAKACIKTRMEFQKWLDNFDDQFVTELMKSFQPGELQELNNAIMENTSDSIKQKQAVVQVKHRVKELLRKKLSLLEQSMKQYARYLDIE